MNSQIDVLTTRIRKGRERTLALVELIESAHDPALAVEVFSVCVDLCQEAVLKADDLGRHTPKAS
jgi:hypothetical protein